MEKINDQKTRMNALRMAILLYSHTFGRLPSKLEDLSFNNHEDSEWFGPFIPWSGPDTFVDFFGFPYHYSVQGANYTLFSPGLETALKNQPSA